MALVTPTRGIQTTRRRTETALGSFPSRSFYVDATDGSDAAAGTHPGTAWQTIAKVNGETFLPGDRILFKRGEVWADTTLVPPNSSGVPGRHIVYGAYGTGNKPRITHSTDFALMTYAGRSYLTFQDLDFRVNYGVAKNVMNFENAAIHHITIENCYVYGGNMSISGVGTLKHDWIIRHNEVSYNYVDAILVQGYNFIVEHNHVHHCCEFTADRSGISINGPGATNNIVRYNTVHHCDAFNNLRGIIVDFADDDNIVEYNTVYECAQGIVVHMADNTTVRGNVVYNGSERAASGRGISVGSAAAGTSYDNTIIRNTIYDCGYGLYVVDSDGGIFKNNIIMNNQNMEIYVSAGNEATNTIDYNCWHNAVGPYEFWWIAGSDNNFADWQTTSSKSVDGINDNPDVVNAGAADFHLTSVSPCRNTGDVVDMSEDMDGVQIPQGAGHDIGAYEYVA